MIALRPRVARGSLPRWQALTVALMCLGYAGYYLCRSDLSVAMPLLIADLARRGMSPDAAKMALGSVASLGVLAYAVGKLPSGWLADFLGGRRNFLMGMAGSILFTVSFGLAGGIPLFTLAWIGNRAVQSMGWAGVVKITSRWFSYSTYGAAMGVISLSYLFGDAASREFMARLIDAGLGWQGVFFAAAATLAVLLLLNLVLLKGCSLIGVFWTAFVERNPEKHRTNLVTLLEWCKEGRIVPHIHASFALTETAKALELIEGRKVAGKVIVNPQC